MGQTSDSVRALQAFEQILPELKKISEQELKPNEIRAELEKSSKSELVEHYLNLMAQHLDVIRAFVALAEATSKVIKSNEQTTE